jgi:cellulose synthase/poly-beta-1,6-N-acetylglucosamine synthase-like glycosyltransferase
MNNLAIALFCAFIILFLIQVPLLVAFISKIRRQISATQQQVTQDDYCLARDSLPSATVILCLRGADPFLSNCLQGLVSQDYPNYQVQIIVDSQEDPASDVVTKTLGDLAQKHFKVSPLNVRYQTCSLKCSALIQAVSSLDDDCEVVALIDSDTVPHSTWLRELVLPLANRKIGFTVGNRWYVPIQNSLGSLVRYIWNISAVLQMNFYTIPWGGCLAFRKERLQQLRLLERWQHTLCEDVILHSAMREQGLEIKFIPSLMMVNREGCQLPDFIRWISRQMLLVKLYHSSWGAIVSYGLLSSLVLSLQSALLVFSAATFQWHMLAWSLGGLVFYAVALVAGICFIDKEIRLLLALRGEQIPVLSLLMIAKIFLALPVAQFAFAISIILAMQVKTVEWRGIFYKIIGPWNIRLVKYYPYSSLGAKANPNTSL